MCVCVCVGTYVEKSSPISLSLSLLPQLKPFIPIQESAGWNPQVLKWVPKHVPQVLKWVLKHVPQVLKWVPQHVPNSTSLYPISFCPKFLALVTI